MARIDNQEGVVRHFTLAKGFQETIADMTLDPVALAEVEEAFIERACFSCPCLHR